MSSEEICAVCGTGPRREHDQKIKDGLINHEWSADGQLVAVKRAPEPPPGAPARGVVSIPDVALRAALVEAGVLTYDDIVRKEVEILGRKLPPAPSVDG